MADRYRTADGWSVETVRLSMTPDHRDGEWIRVRYYGFFVADVRSIPELARYFPVAALEPDGLGRGHSLYALRRGAVSYWRRSTAGRCQVHRRYIAGRWQHLAWAPDQDRRGGAGMVRAWWVPGRRWW
jgi:hypothetical protein